MPARWIKNQFNFSQLWMVYPGCIVLYSIHWDAGPVVPMIQVSKDKLIFQKNVKFLKPDFNSVLSFSHKICLQDNPCVQHLWAVNHFHYLPWLRTPLGGQSCWSCLSPAYHLWILCVHCVFSPLICWFAAFRPCQLWKQKCEHGRVCLTWWGGVCLRVWTPPLIEENELFSDWFCGTYFSGPRYFWTFQSHWLGKINCIVSFSSDQRTWLKQSQPVRRAIGTVSEVLKCTLLLNQWVIF